MQKSCTFFYLCKKEIVCSSSDIKNKHKVVTRPKLFLKTFHFQFVVVYFIKFDLNKCRDNKKNLKLHSRQNF